MAEEVKKKQGAYTLELPKDGNDENGFWTIHLKEMDEAAYIAASNYFRKEKDLDGIRFILRNLYAGGDNVDSICKDFRAIVASAEQILKVMMPQGQGRIKKN